MAEVHIIAEDGRWKVAHDGDDLLLFDTREGAVHAGEQVAAVAGCELVVVPGETSAEGADTRSRSIG